MPNLQYTATTLSVLPLLPFYPHSQTPTTTASAPTAPAAHSILYPIPPSEVVLVAAGTGVPIVYEELESPRGLKLLESPGLPVPVPVIPGMPIPIPVPVPPDRPVPVGRELVGNAGGLSAGIDESALGVSVAGGKPVDKGMAMLLVNPRR